jgi:GntR family transcriptional regulator
MFVTDGAQRRLVRDERQRFVENEWPKVLEQIERLGLDAAELLAAAKPSESRGDEDD